MKKTLDTLFEKSIALGSEEYTNSQIKTKWIGNPPATPQAIKTTEKRLGIKLPQDYIELVTIANGFPTCSNAVEPSFLQIEDIDLYKHFDGSVIDVWQGMEGLEDVVSALEKAILIAGVDEEQQFLLIPPNDGEQLWKYWKFAMWMPGQQEYEGLQNYFEQVIKFLNKKLKR